MSGDYPNGLSRSGRDRLEYIEQQLSRVMEMQGGLGNKIDLTSERLTALRDRLERHDGYHRDWDANHSRHVDQHEARHTAHDERHRISETRWKVAGVIAGVLAAAVAIIARGGVPDVTLP